MALYIVVSGVISILEQALRTMLGIPSGPCALYGGRFDMCSSICSEVIGEGSGSGFR